MKNFFLKFYQSKEESRDELSSETVTITVLALDCLQYYHIPIFKCVITVAVYCQYTVFMSPAKCSQDLKDLTCAAICYQLLGLIGACPQIYTKKLKVGGNLQF